MHGCAGANIEAVTAWTMTPLYWAANGGSPEHQAVAKMLLGKGRAPAQSPDPCALVHKLGGQGEGGVSV